MMLKKIKEIAAKYPNKIAIIYNDHLIDYAQLLQIILKLAHGLRAIGIAPGDRVLIALPNLPHNVFSYFAILEAGAVVVPINYLLSRPELTSVLEISNPKAIIYWDRFEGVLTDFFKNPKNVVKKIVLGRREKPEDAVLTELISQSSAEMPSLASHPDNLALIQFTAGINDLPVGAEFSQENMLANVDAVTQFFRFTQNDVFGCSLPLFISANQNTMINAALTAGGTVVLFPKLETQTIAAAIDKYHITALMGTPNFFTRLAEVPTEIASGSSLRLCLSILSRMSDQLAANFFQRFRINLLNAYAVTEAGGLAAAVLPSLENQPDLIGIPLPGMEMQIHDQHGEQILNETVGEIALRSNALFKKYWQNENLNLIRFKNGWFYPGDLGKKNADGSFTIVDRKSEVILKSGFYIYATEIEQILKSHPKVKEAAVISIPHPLHKEDVLAFVVPLEANSTSAQEIIDYCREQLPVYKCPQDVKFLSTLPKTKMGRILKRKLKNDKP